MLAFGGPLLDYYIIFSCLEPCASIGGEYGGFLCYFLVLGALCIGLVYHCSWRRLLHVLFIC